jgi:DNA polymerase III epsilon subunit-like protein
MKEFELIAIDVETTGLDPREHLICEFGAIKFNQSGEVIDSFSILVDPGRSIPFPAIKVHGIKLDI